MNDQERRRRIVADRLAERQRTGADPCDAPSVCGAPHEEVRIPRMRARISREAVRALAQGAMPVVHP